jgi:hypothetical protein
LALGPLCAGTVQAETAAFARLDDLTIEVIDLTPDDGRRAGAVFEGLVDGQTVNIRVTSGGVTDNSAAVLRVGAPYDDNFAIGMAIGTVTSTFGNPFRDGRRPDMAVTARTMDAGEVVDAYGYPLWVGVTLLPNTQLVVSGRGRVAADTTLAPEWANGSIEMVFTGVFGSIYGYDIIYDSVVGGVHTSTPELQRVVSATMVNDDPRYTQYAYLQVLVAAYANGGGLAAMAPVPEPASLALWLAGLGVVGGMRRRRS